MSVDLNNTGLHYQRQFNHQNLTTKSSAAKAVARADELFATPKKKPHYVSGAEIIKRSELEYERAIERQRAQRMQRDLADPPSKQQRKQPRSNRSSSEN